MVNCWDSIFWLVSFIQFPPYIQGIHVLWSDEIKQELFIPCLILSDLKTELLYSFSCSRWLLANLLFQSWLQSLLKPKMLTNSFNQLMLKCCSLLIKKTAFDINWLCSKRIDDHLLAHDQLNCASYYRNTLNSPLLK